MESQVPRVLALPRKFSLLKPGCHHDTLFCGTGAESKWLLVTRGNSAGEHPVSPSLQLSCASLTCSLTPRLVLCALVCSTREGHVRLHLG